MKRRWLLAAFAALVVLQLTVPAKMIDKRQATLAHGAPYKFSIGPVDPYDPFLGRYLILNLETAVFEKWKGAPLERGQTVYAVLETDRRGFARFRNLSMDAPGTRDYLKLRVAWQSGPQVRLQMPFERYYLEENAAQAAWRLRPPGQRQPIPAYVLVRVKDGFGVIEDLYFEDKPLLEYMHQKGIWPPRPVFSPQPDEQSELQPKESGSPAPDSDPANRAEDPGGA